MFVSKDTPPTLAMLQAREDRDLAKATQRHSAVSTLLKALPEGTPVPTTVNDFGYCAQASMAFEGQGLVQRLLELYPPLPLVDVTEGSRSQKPRKYLRENEERGIVVDVHPVLLKYEGSSESRRPAATSARWWTTLDQRDVEVVVKGASPDELGIDKARYDADTHSYSTGACTFFIRKVLDVGGRLDALELWRQSWAEFADRKGYHAARRSFVMAIRAKVERQPDIALRREDLPEPHYLKPLQALAAGKDIDLMATLAALQEKQRNRQAHQWDRLGDFHELFDSTQVDELLAFANDRIAAYRPAEAQAQAEFDQVRAWLTEFFATHGPVQRGYALTPYVQQLCRKATGLLVHLGVSERERKEVYVSARIGENREMGRHLSLQSNLEMASLRPQDLPVDYA